MVTILSLCHSPVAIREIQKQTEAKIEDQISHYRTSPLNSWKRTGAKIGDQIGH